MTNLDFDPNQDLESTHNMETGFEFTHYLSGQGVVLDATGISHLDLLDAPSSLYKHIES